MSLVSSPCRDRTHINILLSTELRTKPSLWSFEINDRQMPRKRVRWISPQQQEMGHICKRKRLYAANSGCSYHRYSCCNMNTQEEVKERYKQERESTRSKVRNDEERLLFWSVKPLTILSLIKYQRDRRHLLLSLEAMLSNSLARYARLSNTILSCQEISRDSELKKSTFLATFDQKAPALVSTHVRNIRCSRSRRLFRYHIALSVPD